MSDIKELVAYEKKLMAAKSDKALNAKMVGMVEPKLEGNILTLTERQLRFFLAISKQTAKRSGYVQRRNEITLKPGWKKDGELLYLLANSLSEGRFKPDHGFYTVEEEKEIGVENMPWEPPTKKKKERKMGVENMPWE